ncbi:MAG TPA: DUF2905 domain-containing protein [Candidatus Binatia bacterium]|jgi:hypothetical protein
MSDLGKALIFLGLILLVIGLVLSFAGKLPWIGNLPGDIIIRRGRFTFYFPITTSILVSVILSLVVYFFKR